MRKTLKNRLSIAGLMLIGVFILSSQASKDLTNDSDITNLLTVESKIGSIETFDLLINGENKDHFFKIEKAIKTPYKLELEKGSYSIIIHRTSKNGIVIGKVETFNKGRIKASASADDEIIFLTISEKSNLSAAGM
jgi:hypothetical protein